jgi:hypothetical protein
VVVVADLKQGPCDATGTALGVEGIQQLLAQPLAPSGWVAADAQQLALRPDWQPDRIGAEGIVKEDEASVQLSPQ